MNRSMKRFRMNHFQLKTWWVSCLAAALLTAGCHKPTYEDLEPAGLKWSMAVVGATTTGERERQAVQALVDKLTTGPLHAQVTWVDPAELAHTVETIANQGGIDLVVTTADVDVANVAAAQDGVRFSVIGEASEPTVDNVRHYRLDRRHVYLLAGFLAAEANKDQREPFTVIVDRPLTAEDEAWKMILAGSRMAGRQDQPVLVLADSFRSETNPTTRTPAGTIQPATNQTGQTGQVRTLTANQPLVQAALSGRSAVLLVDALPEQAWPKLRAKNMGVVRTSEEPSTWPAGARVLAEPVVSLSAAVQGEAEQLMQGRWKGKQTVTLAPKRLFQLLQPELFPDKQGVVARYELYEAEVLSGALKPEEYLKD